MLVYRHVLLAAIQRIYSVLGQRLLAYRVYYLAHYWGIYPMYSLFDYFSSGVYTKLYDYIDVFGPGGR